jgi:xanthine dehydrogenase accessory factor
MREVLAKLNATLGSGLSCVYCAVVATRGSTPQKAGASMLVFPDGSQFGTLGGGCVEAEVKQRVLCDHHAGNGPAVYTFHLDDNYGWDDGLICGGRMTILAGRLRGDSCDRASADYYRTLLAFAEQGEAFVEAVVIANTQTLSVGDRYLFNSDGAAVACIASQPAWEAVKSRLPALSSRPQPEAHGGIAYLPTLARITLLIVGGGHVGQAVARLAAEVDFRIWAIDDREKYASRDRFPSAERLIVGEIGPVLRELAPQLNPNTYALILTRGHNHDEEALYYLAHSACDYVGMIGSRRKIRLIFDDLIAKDIKPEALARVRAPVGLDIGSQTVSEIAVSIVAELIACRNRGNLRARETRG